MAGSTLLAAAADHPHGFRVASERLRVCSRSRFEWIDLTDRVNGAVERAAIDQGIVSVQTLHTTTAIVVNEGEPLLHDDVRRLCEYWAPRDGGYLHDRDDLRTVNVVPDERPNGDSHARALLFGSSETVAILNGRPCWGRWQRLYLVELDGGRPREVAVTVLGVGGVRGRGVRRNAAVTDATRLGAVS